MQGFSPAGQLLDLVTGFWATQAICVAANLGIADLLGKRGTPIEELATATHSNVDALYRLMRALAASGVFAEVAPRQFAQTAVGALLRQDAPGGLRDFSRFQGDGWHWNAWGSLLDTVRSGRPAAFGDAPDSTGAGSCFDYLAARPESAAVFDGAMAAYTSQVNAALLESYDFADVEVVLDIGGGSGALLAMLLDENPRLHGILFDRQQVTVGAVATFEDYDVSDRVRIESGDFFSSVPGGADLAILCAVLHDWDDSRATQILRNASRSLPPDGRLLIVENVLPEDSSGHRGKWIDLEMLLITGGRERTQQEFERLLGGAGLTLERVLPTATSVSIVVASPNPRRASS